MEDTVGVIGLMLYLGLIVFFAYVGWRIYEKAGQEGWKAVVPIYNIYVLTQIVGRPAWWVLLLLVPIVNIIVGAILYVDLAKSFGKGVGFGIGLLIIGFICGPILAFGDAEYQGPAAA